MPPIHLLRLATSVGQLGEGRGGNPPIVLAISASVLGSLAQGLLSWTTTDHR